MLAGKEGVNIQMKFPRKDIKIYLAMKISWIQHFLPRRANAEVGAVPAQCLPHNVLHLFMWNSSCPLPQAVPGHWVHLGGFYSIHVCGG